MSFFRVVLGLFVVVLFSGCLSANSPGVLLAQDVNKVVYGGDVNSFLDLNDTPASYSGFGGDCVVVNSGESGLEFSSCAVGGSGSGGSFSESFVDGDLVDGVLSVSHNLNSSYPLLALYDGFGEFTLPDSVFYVDVNSVDVNVLSFVPLSGMWNVRVVSGTGVSLDSNNGYVASFSNGDLVDGVLTVSHDLNKVYPQVIVYSDLNKVVWPDDVEYVTVNRIDVNLLSFVVLNNTWRVRITANVN